MTRLRVLMLTVPELGHANVCIATAQALVEEHRDVEICIASCAELKRNIHEAFAKASDAAVRFHALPGPSITESINRDPNPAHRLSHISLLRPDFWNTPAITEFILTRVFLSWTVDEFTAIFNETKELIQSMAPHVCVVDGLFSPALTAARYLRSQVQHGADSPPFKLALLSPNTLKDFTQKYEPVSRLISQWPVPGAALTMPIPWYLVPLNFYFFVRMVASVASETESASKVASIRKTLGLLDLDVSTYSSVLMDGLAGIDLALLSSRRELDFPCLDLSHVPSEYMEKVVQCGPILRQSAALLESDPDLGKWMKGARVVYINLGTICEVIEEEALEMAKALRYLLDVTAKRNGENGKVRILWKLKKDQIRGPAYDCGPGSKVFEILGGEIENDDARIVNWIAADPSSVLDSGYVACAVTHGGASSFYESLMGGVPQVVLPVWADTFDFANRAEMLGIGVWGNKNACPRWTASELGPVLVDVLWDRNEQFATASRALAEVCRQKGRGSNVAARKVIDLSGVSGSTTLIL